MKPVSKRTLAPLSVVLMTVISAGLLLAPPAAADMAGPSLYERDIARWQPLRRVQSREFKFLVNPKFFADGREKGFRLIWSRVKEVAARNGYTISDKDKKPFKQSFATKEYFDTPDFRLRKSGYVVRITTKYKHGKPKLPFKVTAKELSPDNLYRILGSRLDFAKGYKGKTEIEENISIAADGSLKGYIEIARKVKLNPADVGAKNLDDFGKIYPALLKLGLPADTKLVAQRAYGYKVKPGKLHLDGDKVKLEIEAWASGKDGPVYVAEVSFAIDTPDFYAMAKTHASAERFLLALGKDAADLAFPDAPKWLGSKVRVLLNLPAK